MASLESPSSDYSKKHILRLIRALNAFGFFIVDTEIEEPNPFYSMLSRMNLAKYFQSKSIGKRFVLISINENLCKLKCREECSKSDSDCTLKCVNSCIARMRAEVIEALKKALTRN